MAGRKKGSPKTGGRLKGVQNRTTKEAREFLEQILFAQFDNLNESLDRMRADNDAKYVDACSKLLMYVLPKKTDVTSDDKPISIALPNITIKTKNDRND